MAETWVHGEPVQALPHTWSAWIATSDDVAVGTVKAETEAECQRIADRICRLPEMEARIERVLAMADHYLTGIIRETSTATSIAEIIAILLGEK